MDSIVVSIPDVKLCKSTFCAVCSCRDLSDNLHMKIFFDLLVGSVTRLDEPLCTLGGKLAMPGKVTEHFCAWH